MNGRKTGQNPHVQGVRERGRVPLCSCSHMRFLFWFERGGFFFIDFVLTDLTVYLIFTNMLSYNSELLANHLSCST